MAAHLHDAGEALHQSISHSRREQASWRTIAVRERLTRLHRLRNHIALDPRALLEAIRLTRSRCADAQILVSEILPFLDAIRFLESESEKLLRPSKADHSARPFWLSGVELEVHREPFGVVLIVAPSNYPLFLPGVQIIQALVAGNAVWVKPGEGASPAMFALRKYAVEAGIPGGLVTILDESPQTAMEAIIAGVDKIWLTGAARTGRAVAKLASAKLTPLVCELSGCDAVILLPGADAALAARAITFGLQLNEARTCMRPHRVLAHQSLEAEFRHELLSRLSSIKVRISSEAAIRLQALLQDARGRGAVHLYGVQDDQTISPFVLAGVAPGSALWNADIFAPVLALNTFDSIEDAVRLHNACDYGLTASIFGPERQARAVAQELEAGTVLINDLIVPTADPRLPFSGCKQSGYGCTRGAEGLLEFTRLKAISVRRSGYQHLDTPQVSDASMFQGAITAAHANGVADRLRGAVRAITAALKRNTRSPRSDAHV